MINMATKQHALYVRGLSKDQKNSLKRIARSRSIKVPVNTIILEMIQERTTGEIEEYNRINLYEKSKLVKK
jgi:hypothetical protein